MTMYRLLSIRFIEVWNDYVDVVDKMDFLIPLYRMIFKTKRWPTSVTLHLVSMSLVNAWITYKEQETAQETKPKKLNQQFYQTGHANMTVSIIGHNQWIEIFHKRRSWRGFQAVAAPYEKYVTYIYVSQKVKTT